MSWLHLQVIADLIGGELQGADRLVNTVITDTRKPDPDALFFALKGPNFDAHSVLESAEPNVAAALVVEKPVAHPAAQIVVEDTRLSLGRLGALWRQRFTIPVIALTGSNGKTTVKEMLWAILRRSGNPLVTYGNLNNDIGVPLTLLRLREHHDCAVIEMGANHAGEIAYLTEMVRPDVAIITNAGSAHMEGFGSLEGVASAKGEIFSGLGYTGTAVINQDDQFAGFWKTLAGQNRILTFGSTEGTDVHIESFDPVVLDVAGHTHPVKLSLQGRHNVINAAAAAAACLAIDIKMDEVVKGLENMVPVSGRLMPCRGPRGSLVIDDSYNANPSSTLAAIDVLAQQDAQQKILVLGDMAELGDEAVSLHAEVGRQATAAGIDHLYSFGALSAAAAESFGEPNHAFLNQSQLIEALQNCITSDTAVLIKGSRVMQMDKVSEVLCELPGDDQQEHDHAA